MPYLPRNNETLIPECETRHSESSGAISRKFYLVKNGISFAFSPKFEPWSISSTTQPNDKKFILSDLKRNIEIINSFANLPQNWNDNGATPFSTSLIHAATRLIQDLEYQPEVFPTGRASILFEYGKPSGEFLSLEVFENKIETFFVPNNETQTLGHCDIVELRRIVNEFHD